METEEKLKKLKNILKKMECVIIAYSGGVDTTFLLAVAKRVLKDKVLAVTAVSPLYPRKELRFAREQAKKLGVKHILIRSREMQDKKFVENPLQRCYYCKDDLYGQLHKLAKKDFDKLPSASSGSEPVEDSPEEPKEKIKYILDGTNYSDRKDFRPGIKAGEKWQICHPLEEAKMTKEEIRLLSKKMGLVTWDKPAQACLASRLPYGEKITLEKLKMVEMAENYLNRLGFKQVRVRTYNSGRLFGDLARIELGKEEMVKLTPLIADKIVKKLKSLGYRYITLDLEGYRTGSMNYQTSILLAEAEEEVKKGHLRSAREFLKEFKKQC